MRILHVASFSGNIGDSANHSGLRFKLKSILPEGAVYDEIEIRRFYVKYDGPDKLQFDLDFANIANNYDLLIIGGGNFFEVWIEGSSTGCTIDIGPEVIEAINTKVLFFGLGFDCYKGYSSTTLHNFFNFVQRLQDKKRFFVTVRNDGSIEQFIERYGVEASGLLRKVPDGGFFINTCSDSSPLIPSGKCNIILSLAKDMPSVRFGKDTEKSGYAFLVKSIVHYIIHMANKSKEVHFTLMPHIYSDLQIINEVIELLPDFIRRNCVGVGPCLLGSIAVDPVFSVYRKADCVVAMRFHASVCSIGLGIPTIGLSTYRKISDLYRELGILDRLVVARDKSFHDELISKTEWILNRKHEVKNENIIIMKKLVGEFDAFLSDFRGFLKNS